MAPLRHQISAMPQGGFGVCVQVVVRLVLPRKLVLQLLWVGHNIPATANFFANVDAIVAAFRRSGSWARNDLPVIARAGVGREVGRDTQSVPGMTTANVQVPSFAAIGSFQNRFETMLIDNLISSIQ